MTTAKESRSSPSSILVDSSEELENIAKQISDHAEAIYQEWKSRGLAPTEILKCHPGSDKTYDTLIPKSSKHQQQQQQQIQSFATTTLLDDDVQLVNNFVHQDKARIASQKLSPSVANINNSSSIERVNSRSLSVEAEKEKNNYVPDVLKDTIEKYAKLHAKPEAPAKPDYLLNHIPQCPFKKKMSSYDDDISNKHSLVVEKCNDEDKNIEKFYKKQNRHHISVDVMKEVTLQEEKLINALRTDTVLSSGSLAEIERKIKDELYTNSLSIRNFDENDCSLAQPQPPQKPNHTPMYVEAPKRLLNSRIISRHELSKLDEKKIELKSIPSPVRPFLSRGSVAERVLIFEKCPEKLVVRSSLNEKHKNQLKIATKLLPPSHTTLQRHLRRSTSLSIPQFYYPNGKPLPSITNETTIQRLEVAFIQFQNYEMPREKFHIIVSICQVPLYWRVPLFMCTQLSKTGCVDGKKFIDFWKQMTYFCHDAASRFIYIISKGVTSRPWILPEDLAPLIQDVVDSHPGLAFLKEAAEFHSRYVHTVIARIFYSVNRSWSGKITTSELRRSNLLDVLQLLEEEEDINAIMAYFSYEHFYVIYCKFWELDRDHDLFIDQQDLARHNDHALSSRIIERIFSGCVTRAKNRTCNIAEGNKMSYTEFVYFLLSEEDKNSPTSIEYWFRCMDIDGDGVLSMYEMEYFYEEQQHRMEQLGIETLPFEDCLCQMLDMIRPARRDSITLNDLKKCKLTPIFFDTFFNLEKYLEHEQKDPFAQKENDEMTDWDRFAAEEYELLVAEENIDGMRFDNDIENNESLCES